MLTARINEHWISRFTKFNEHSSFKNDTYWFKIINIE